MASKNSKRNIKEDSSSESDGPDDRNPPPKKSKPTASKNSNEEENSFPLDKNRFVKVRQFKGKLFVDIREFYEKNGELLPGKKGISLHIGQWNKLKEQIDDIQEAIEKF